MCCECEYLCGIGCFGGDECVLVVVYVYLCIFVIVEVGVMYVCVVEWKVEWFD